MFLVFLDEFGHVGPYVSRSDSRFCQSPVFGLAGFILPHEETRSFATWFLQQKQNLFSAEIEAAGAQAATWEKKGARLLTTRNFQKYPNLQQAMGRLINHISRKGGRLFYCGTLKHRSPEASNAEGLYDSVLARSITQIDQFCSARNEYCLIILDQYASRARLLETAKKTMFGARPARSLIEPPFHVESNLYQTIQAADWIATLISRLLAFRASPEEFSQWEWAERLFGDRLERVLTHSVLKGPVDLIGLEPLPPSPDMP